MEDWCTWPEEEGAFWQCQDDQESHRWHLERRPAVSARGAHRNRTGDETAVNINDAYSSNYVRAMDIKRPTTLTIKTIGYETVGQGADAQDKLVLGFQEARKGMVLNKTNALSIAALYGEETDDWVGKSITLYTTKVQGPNGITDGIRIQPSAGAAQSAPSPAAPSTPPTDFDDDIPF